MSEIKIRNRHRLPSKDIKELSIQLMTIFGKDVFSGENEVDTADIDTHTIIIVNNEIIGYMVEAKPLFTVRGLLKYKPEKRYVTVDMGAVKYVANGADVMSPGIVDADPSIKSGNYVWIRDVNNKRPIAVGKALVDRENMGKGFSGKAVKNIHHVGDDLWNCKI
jgi:PUA domain protein